MSASNAEIEMLRTTVCLPHPCNMSISIPMSSYSPEHWSTYAAAVKPTPAKATASNSCDSKQVEEDEVRSLGVRYHHFKGTQEEQDSAIQLIGELSLHIPRVATYERDARSKLTILESDSNPLKSNHPELDVTFQRYRRTYQCQSGADNTQGHHASRTRNMPWEDLGCGFWARMTTTQLTVGKDEVLITVDEIFGNLVHSGRCVDQIEMWRNPPIPLHPDLRGLLLDWLRDRTPLAVVKERARAYSDHDTSSIYRTLGGELGIKVHTHAQDNLDAWLGPKKAAPDASLTAACLFYSPEVPELNERFMLILSTPLQQRMAWKFGHKRQVLMDLTFGFCSARALLVILMVIDDANKGIPVAQMIFTAKKEAKAVHADYNQALLDRLLGLFKEKMGLNEKGEAFEIAVASTDNDTRERYALNKNFPGVLLLLCMFHVLQCWRNQVNRSLVTIPKGPARAEIRSRIWTLLMKLIRDISDYATATSLFNSELAFFRTLAQRGTTPLQKKQSKAGIHFLNYLHSYLSVEDYWRSWRLKNKFFKGYEHSGRLPRIDLWVLILVTRVIPEFFAGWVERRHQLAYYGAMRFAPSPSSSLESISTPDDIFQPTRPKFTTVQQVQAAATKFMDHAFESTNARSIIFTKTFDEEHKLAVTEFEISMAELGEEDGEDVVLEELEGVPFLGPPADEVNPNEDDIEFNVEYIPSQECVEAATSPRQNSVNEEDEVMPGPEESDSDISHRSFVDGAILMPSSSLPSIPASHSNTKVTAMMHLQRAEDTWLQAIKDALNSGLSRNDIEKMISPSIARRLSLHALLDDDPIGSSFEFPGDDDALSDNSEPSLRPSPSVIFQDPPNSTLLAALGREDPALQNRTNLPAFSPQKKRRRFQSNGVR
ncbi:hypothetical protein DFP72DRAFT_1149006 [Ephemerocybe angulata]|uniref:MULE transposase domain-containing protein n=1 Tax=Ephemerocybe angulata TaxID=980116 RepID=A0A8H6HJH3_9AGAR|nr:hypothetical protein DFP72DRAFT_1149006 [Tulosesus angulatus]